MPKRFTTKEVKDLFADYGYIVPNDFVYRNSKQNIRVYDEMNDRHINLSVQKLKYQTERAATKRPKYFDSDLLNLPLSDVEIEATGSSFERWCEKQTEEFNELDDDYKQLAFEFYQNAMPIISQRRNADIEFDDLHNIPQLYGLIQALKTINYAKYDVRLTITDSNGITSYAHANENTINFLFNSFSEHQDVGESSDVLLNNICDV